MIYASVLNHKKIGNATRLGVSEATYLPKSDKFKKTPMQMDNWEATLRQLDGQQIDLMATGIRAH